jgi:hypothetical protein
MSLLPVELPEFNRPVRAIIKHFMKWATEEVVLKAVNEDDCSWRFEEDNCELANEWNVIYWEYI